MKKLIIVSVVALAALSVAVTAALATSSKKTANVQVCVLLPDTSSSVRWVQFDAPTLAAAFKKAGVKARITNALNDAQKQKAQAAACLAAGAKVVIETMLDPGSAVAIEKSFTSKGGYAIDYDRLVPNSPASAYITFDGNKVGRAQATGVLAALKGKTKPVVAELWGGQTDANAFLFKSGNDAVLNPLFKSGKVVKGPQQFVDGWLATNAATDFQQFLVTTNNKIDGVIAANDNIAGAVVATLKAKGLPKIALSGQDASALGVQNVISGWQTMTVYKKDPLEAQVAAKAAVQLLKGQKVTGINAWCDGKKNLCTAKKSKAEPSILLVPITITKANYKILFADKFLKRGEVCVGPYKKFCQ